MATTSQCLVASGRGTDIMATRSAGSPLASRSIGPTSTGTLRDRLAATQPGVAASRIHRRPHANAASVSAARPAHSRKNFHPLFVVVVVVQPQLRAVGAGESAKATRRPLPAALDGARGRRAAGCCPNVPAGATWCVRPTKCSLCTTVYVPQRVYHGCPALLLPPPF